MKVSNCSSWWRFVCFSALVASLFMFVVGCADTQPKVVYVEKPAPPKKSSTSTEACEVMYEVYKQCYSKGISCNGNKEQCATIAAKLWTEMEKKDLGGPKLREGISKLCALACVASAKNIGIPSYTDFTNQLCND